MAKFNVEDVKPGRPLVVNENKDASIYFVSDKYISGDTQIPLNFLHNGKLIPCKTDMHVSSVYHPSYEQLLYFVEHIHYLALRAVTEKDSNSTLQPPDLPCDAYLKEAGINLTPNGKIERRIVWNLIHYLQNNGYLLVKIFDGEEEILGIDPEKAMDCIFDTDSGTMFFQRGPFSHWVDLQTGNGVDIISDYTLSVGDGDTFGELMENFDSDYYV